MLRMTTLSVLLALVAACGRPNTPSEVKFVGAGYMPDEVGPSPTPYGGVVEYDHIDFGGAGLPLALMGLSGTDPAGPQLLDFAPPYEGVFGFSYIFDEKLTAGDTFANVGAAPPELEDSCYASFEPTGPIGSFTTVDLGDFLEFATGDQGLMAPDAAGLRMERSPTDYPPDAQGVFVYYIGFEYYKPFELMYNTVNPEDPTNPMAMGQRVYRRKNYPFGESVVFSYPGGFADYNQAVSSIPHPSSTVDSNRMDLPNRLGPVMMSWKGPRFDARGNEIASTAGTDEAINRCFEFYEGRGEDPARALADCGSPVQLPSALATYNSFEGQMYTGPWESDDGVTFQWDTTDDAGQPLKGDQIVLSVRWMAPVDRDDPNYARRVVAGTSEAASTCATDTSFEFDAQTYTVDGTPNGELVPSLQGDPFSQLANVTCLLKNDGEFTLTKEHVARALEHVALSPDGAGGVVFFFSRGNEADANSVPPVKDQFGQKHMIDPIKMTARSIRIGRFHWNNDSATVGEGL